MTETSNLSEVDGGRLHFKASMFARIEEGLKCNPDGRAIVAMHHPATYLSQLAEVNPVPGKSDCLVWTHRQLFQAAMKVSAGLLAHDVKPGSTLVTLIPDCVEWALLLYVSSVLKLTMVPLNFAALDSASGEELRNLMVTLEPAVLVVPNEAGVSAIHLILAGAAVTPTVKLILDSESLTDYPQGWTSLSVVAQGGIMTEEEKCALLEEARVEDPDRIASIYFTSGTSSGKPKGCPRHVGGLCSVYEAQKATLDLDEHSAFLLHSANFRIISSLSNAVWTAGACIVIPGSKFSPKGNLDAIEQHAVTHVLVLPAQMHAIVAEPSFSSRKLGTVRHFMQGADVITKDVLTKGARAFPQAKHKAAHGMTEGGGLLAWPFGKTPVEDLPYFAEIAPLGTTEVGSRLRIVDLDSGRVAERGQFGELHVFSQSVIKHYLGGVFEDSFYEDDVGRWFKTGDLAMMNQRGIIYVLGRIKDVIKRAGIPIAPAALESCIDKFTQSQASVVGMPHPTLGAEPVAIVRSLGSKSENEVKQQVVDLFGKDYALGAVLSLDQLGLKDFPINSTGKIVKITLQEEVAKLYS